jgi:hypothetical protein
MKIIPKTGLELINFPLPIYNMTAVAEAFDENGNDFSIFVGLDENMIAQLKSFSLDKSDLEIQNNTSDLKRFGEGSYEEWYKKERTPFILVHTATNALAALVWFGPKPLGRKSVKHLSKDELKEDETKLKHDNWHTISYRTYPSFRGKGLMKKFADFSIGMYMKSFPNIKLWAGINTENVASKKLIEGLGFKTLERLSDHQTHWLIAVRY